MRTGKTTNQVESEGARLRSNMESTLSALGTIYRPTLATDHALGASRTWNPVRNLVNIPMSVVKRMHSGEQDIADKPTEKIHYYIFCHEGVDVRLQDRIIISGTTYEVEGMDPPTTNEPLRRVYAVLLR